MVIQTEARERLNALREYRTEKEYLDKLWTMRRAEAPKFKRLNKIGWPIKRAEDIAANVTSIRKGKRA